MPGETARNLHRDARWLLFLACLLSLALLPFPLSADSKPKKPSSRGESAQPIKVNVDLVSVTATVTDKKQNLIKDLTKDDFQIFEEGVEQQITRFQVEVAPGVAVPLGTKEGATDSEIPSVSPLSRKVILFVDDYHLEFGNLARLKNAAQQFIRGDLNPIDQIALITASGKYSTEFTKYREYVISSLQNVMPTISRSASNTDCPPLTDYQAYEIRRNDVASFNDSMEVAIADAIKCARLDGLPNARDIAAAMARAEAQTRLAESERQTRQTLLALQALSRRLKNIEGQKSLLFLSEGFLLGDLYFDVQNAIDAAIRANTIVHVINAAGLEAEPPLGDVSTSTVASLETAPVKLRLQSFSRSAKEDPLNALAADTGGLFLHNNNDLHGMLKVPLTRTQVTYLLGYYSSKPQRDGTFRKIQVKVKRPDVVVTARKGYYAPKGDAEFEAQKNSDVREALAMVEDLKEIPVSMTYNITHSDPARPALAVLTKVDVHKITFQKRENRNRNVFTIVTVVYDVNDHFIEGLEKRIDFNLTHPNYRNVLTEGLHSQTTFRLTPGNYKVRTVVREAGEMKLGSATQVIEIAN